MVADYDLTLGNLIGIIKTFFEKIGITQLRFKPAYNPYVLFKYSSPRVTLV